MMHVSIRNDGNPEAGPARAHTITNEAIVWLWQYPQDKVQLG